MTKDQKLSITFLGTAGEVTGSCYLVEGQGIRFLVDCGMFQGDRNADSKNRSRFSFEPRDIDFVVITHAHIDHSGLLPKLARDGFKGSIFTTRATAELLEIMLRDSAHIHESTALRENRKRKNHGSEVTPLYTMTDAENALSQMDPQPYDERFSPHKAVSIRMREAGHILGSAILEIWVKNDGKKQKIVFSGDLGQPGRPILCDPSFIEDADYLLVESTYGDRQHKALAPSLDEFVDVINDTITSGKGNIIAPAFAVGRTQEVIYYLHHLTRIGRVKDLTVYLDSPMAQKVTELTKRHINLFDKEAQKLAAWHAHSGDELTLKFTKTVQESMAINSILITGYQAHGTLGRRLVDGAQKVRIFGKEITVKARIVTIGGFSAHADQNAILNWLDGFKSAPKHTFITHGEPHASSSLERKITSRLDWPVTIPTSGEKISIGEK